MSSAMSMAYRSLRRRKGRTALTVSGIIVGVAMILVLLSLAAGTSTQANRLINLLGGADIIVVNSTLPAGGGGAGGGLRAIFGTSATVNQSLTGSIGSISGVGEVSPQLSVTGYIDERPAFIFGIDPSTYAKATGGLNIISGTSLSPGGANEIVIGNTLAQRLNIDVGSSIPVASNASTASTNYKVVGIFETGSAILERSGYISLSNAQNLSNETGTVTEVFVKATDPNQVSQLTSKISSTIPGVRAVTPSAFAESASQLSNTLTTFFTLIGLVALLAGAFGVINTMIMSTTERTREIGTLRAIGARKGQILTIFMSEAFLIGLIGAAAGVLIGSLVTTIIPLLAGGLGTGRLGQGVGSLFRGTLSPVLTSYDLALSFSLGLVVGILSGLYPAWRASRMNPVEALRHV